MALESPNSVDVQDIQFKLHDRWDVFSPNGNLRNNVNLLAVSSSQGMLFAGNPNAPELKVILLKNLVESKTTKALSARKVELPNVPNVLAVSADGTMLAVNITMNGSAVLQIYRVPSFVTTIIKLLYTLRLSPEEGVSALQILWNPVLTNHLAVILSNGAVGAFSLKDGGNFEFHSLDKQHRIRSGCWSPKGKQMVLGFPNGKLQQFKPDLTLAKTIVCPASVHPGPFETIAVHWLSTYQFAVAFLQQGDEQSPVLYIVNAPKGHSPSYVNYYDICYSAIGPRQHQISFTHIQAWNMLLVTSANGVELGLLGTAEKGDLPAWVQYVLLDESRIEMPLTAAKEETYPIGFALDTSSSHQLVIAEKKLPVMPMVHVLSTHGCLLSFNFLNLKPNVPDVCSPPPPITDTSAMFKPLRELLEGPQKETPTTPQSATTSFSFNANLPSPSAVSAAHVKETPQPLPTQTITFGSINKEPNDFAALLSGSTSAHLGAKATEQSSQVATTQTPVQPTATSSKPLYTVPATFTPPAATATASQQKKQSTPQPPNTSANAHSMAEVYSMAKHMIAMKLNSFNSEVHECVQQSSIVLPNTEQFDEMKSYTKRLLDLQEINDQANDRSTEADIQHLRQSLKESYAMLQECRTRLEAYKNPDSTRLTSINAFDPNNQRRLAKLKSMELTNRAHLEQLQLQIEAQWADYQDLVRRNSKSRMHIPCLDGIYQHMTRVKDVVAAHRTKINAMRTKLKQKGLVCTSLNAWHMRKLDQSEVTMESLADSIISMSLCNAADVTRSRIPPAKLDALRNSLQHRPIVHIKPNRPDRVGVRSEVIMETKLLAERKSREGAVTNLSKMQQEKIATSSSSVGDVITKPTATKPTSAMKGQPAAGFAPPSASAPCFSFGPSSSFVKTATATNIKAAEAPKPPLLTTVTLPTLSFVPPSAAEAGKVTAAAPTPTFGQTKPVVVVKTEAANQKPAPISFAAKVVSSEASTKPSTLVPKPATVTSPNKENKSLGEVGIPKSFSFGSGGQDSVSVFGAGGGDVKAPLTAANNSLFGGLTTSKSSAFSVKPSLSFNFNGAGTNTTTATAATTVTANTPFSLTNITVTTKSNAAATATPTPTPTTKSLQSPVSNTATLATPLNSFSGFGQSVGREAKTTTTPSFSFGGALNLAASTATTPPKPAVTKSSVANSGVDVLESLSSFNICRPFSSEAKGSDNCANVFGGKGFTFTGGGSSRSFSFVTEDKTSSTVGTPTPSTVTAAVTSNLSDAEKTAVASTAPTTQQKPATSASSNVFSFSLAGLESSTSPTKPSALAAPQAATAISSSPSTVATSSAAATNSSASSVFAAAAATTSAAASVTPSPFASTPPAVSSPSSTGSIFAGIPKSDKAAFGNEPPPPGTSDEGFCSAPAAANSPPFAGSLFGGSKPSTFGASNMAAAAAAGGGGGSLFGGSSSPNPFQSAATGASLFSSAAKPAEGGGLFGSPTKPAAAAGSSIFGQKSASSVFGTVSGGQQASSVFATSIFSGGSAAASPPAQSIFGALSQTSFGQASTEGASPFSQPAFGSPNAGSFAQGGASVAQSGFGSPPQQQQQQQQTSPFAAPVFGGAPVFGSPPAFGGQPSFGGAPTFGSPKGFGSFAAATPAAPAFASPTQQNNLFETLGATETGGLSFGNLAQNTSANAAKPAFGGSSFMNYRA